MLSSDRLRTCLVSRLYPPGSHNDLRSLHHSIISSSSPDHYKYAVMYYILRDISHSNRRLPDKFASTVYLPAKYRMFIEGIWYMDRLKFEVGARSHL